MKPFRGAFSPPLPAALPPFQRWQTSGLKLLLLLLGQQWKHSKSPRQIFSLIFSPPPFCSPTTTTRPCKASKIPLASTTRRRGLKWAKVITHLRVQICSHFVSVQCCNCTLVFNRRWGNPLGVAVSSPYALFHMPLHFFVINLPGHLVLAWVTPRSNSTFFFLFLFLRHEAPRTLKNMKWRDNRYV